MTDWGNARAIETRYAGHKFRSRVEARWAVFLDAAGVRWMYEPEGFDLDGVWYLPDFWLPDIRCWLEVKHTWLPCLGPEYVETVTKAWRLANRTEAPVLVVTGEFDPLRQHRTIGYGPASLDEGDASWYPLWTACLRCGRVGLAEDDEPWEPWMIEDAIAEGERLPEMLVRMPCAHAAYGSSPALESAFGAARTARFERAAR